MILSHEVTTVSIATAKHTLITRIVAPLYASVSNHNSQASGDTKNTTNSMAIGDSSTPLDDRFWCNVAVARETGCRLEIRRSAPTSKWLFDRAGSFAKNAATQLHLRSLEGFEFDSGSSRGAHVVPGPVRGPKLQGDFVLRATGCGKISGIEFNFFVLLGQGTPPSDEFLQNNYMSEGFGRAKKGPFGNLKTNIPPRLRASACDIFLRGQAAPRQPNWASSPAANVDSVSSRAPITTMRSPGAARSSSFSPHISRVANAKA